MKMAQLAAAAVITFTFPAASAQDRAVAPTLIDALAACLEIRGDQERLVCTDGAARRLVDASRRQDFVIVDKEAVKSTRRSLFGFTLPRIGLFGRDGPDKAIADIDQLDAKIVDVSGIGGGKFSLAVEGGARWATTEAWSGTTPPARGLVLTIKRGALGNYFVKIGKYGAVRAVRIG